MAKFFVIPAFLLVGIATPWRGRAAIRWRGSILAA
jgi:hypothetical protein